MRKLSVEAAPEENDPDEPKNIGAVPEEWWLLVELALAECPQAALKAFRKSVIGRGKPLTAKQADAALAGARHVTATGPIIDSRHIKHEHVPEPMYMKIERYDWYIDQGLPVIFARPGGYEYTDEEHWIIDAARDMECKLIFLQFDDEAVDRIEGVD